jgi:glucosamine--fructose-6-phosphate aminotransferase (isomerizing)
MSLVPEQTRMFHEAAEAPERAAEFLRLQADALERLGAELRKRAPRVAMTCGRGSSDHAGLYAKYLIETELGVLTASAAPSVSSLYASTPALEGVVCLAISQSGKSPDLLAAVKAARGGGAFVIAFVNVEDSPLAGLADAVVPLSAGPERSVAATKSYILALIAVARLVAAWRDDDHLRLALDRLPAQLTEAWALDWSDAVEPLARARNLYVVGRGLGLGVASEAALKLKETSGLHAEAFSSAEVRHGPMALVKAGFPVMMLSQHDETLHDVDQLASDFAARGAEVILAGDGGAGRVLRLPTLASHPALEPILLIQSFYRLANSVAVARGCDPDRPPHLNKVTETV